MIGKDSDIKGKLLDIVKTVAFIRFFVENILESPESTSPLSPLKTDTKRQKLLEILREALTNTEKHKR